MTSTLILTLFFSAQSCISPTTPPNSKSLSLTVADVSCTEAWLNLTTNNISLPANILIKKNGDNFLNITFAGNDTTLYDSTLSPNKTYTYQAEYSGGFNLSTSEAVTAKTMDTTSNNFTWQLYTLGNAVGTSSMLDDVAIVNDTLAYAVGAIYLKDSTGQIDPNAYNLVKWDGHSWQLLRIQFYSFCGQQSTGSYPAKAVLTVSDTEIWVASNNSQIAIWNGTKQKGVMCLPVSVNKMWAANRNAVYTVGSLGQIGYYQNGVWQRIESGTTTDLRDIWGSTDGKTVWACGYSNDYSQSCILKYDGNIWSTLWEKQSNQTPPYGFLVSTLWAGSKYLYVGAADGIYRNALIGNGSTHKVLSLPSGPHRIRGIAENNIVVACDDESIWYFNGASWFKETQSTLLKPLYSIAVSTNTIVAVGFDATTINTKGIILVGRRN